jgi:hypothetical protein
VAFPSMGWTRSPTASLILLLSVLALIALILFGVAVIAVAAVVLVRSLQATEPRRARNPDPERVKREVHEKLYLPYEASLDLAKSTRRDHLFEVERITFMADQGYLTEAELEKIAAEGREAKARIGTDAEQTAAHSPNFGGDKLCAARADAVLDALKRRKP